MQHKERIEVYVRIEAGKAVCLCHAGRKNCDRDCERDTVIRDPYYGWKTTMNLSRYGPPGPGG